MIATINIKFQEDNMKYTIAAITLAVGLVSQAQAADFVEGKDYKVVANQDNIKGDAIIVREFFWYGCSHCYHFEPIIQKWKATKPADVAFFSTPAALNPVWENSARGFYSAQLMGYQEKTHQKLFDAIFKNGQMNQEIAGLGENAEKAIVEWYASQGLDKKKFESMMHSFAVDNKVGKSLAAAQRYKIGGTPAVVVQGKYVITADPSKIPEIIDFLVEKVRKDKKQKSEK